MAEEKSKANTPVYKKWWFWVIIAVVLIGIGGAGAASNKDAKKVGEGQSSESSDSNSGDETQNQIFKVGDVIAIDGREVTVEKVQREWTGEYSTPKDGKEYVMITVKLENKSDEKISYGGSEWKIEDSEGAIGNQTYVLDNDSDLDYGDLAVSGKKSGTIVFEVPKGDKNLKIHYQPNMFSEREAVIELQ